MAKMKTENYKRYYNEYTPSWVKRTDEEKEREEKYYARLVGESKKAKEKRAEQGKKKISTHNGKNSAKKFYAVKNGRKKNIIVKTWAECSKLVLGYPNASYKGFNTEKEAKDFLGIIVK